jgi:hypothetical protein
MAGVLNVAATAYPSGYLGSLQFFGGVCVAHLFTFLFCLTSSCVHNVADVFELSILVADANEGSDFQCCLAVAIYYRLHSKFVVSMLQIINYYNVFHLLKAS